MATAAQEPNDKPLAVVRCAKHGCKIGWVENSDLGLAVVMTPLRRLPVGDVMGRDAAAGRTQVRQAVGVQLRVGRAAFRQLLDGKADNDGVWFKCDRCPDERRVRVANLRREAVKGQWGKPGLVEV